MSVAVSASRSTVDGTNSVTLTASVTNDKNAAGVSWSVSGGGTLSDQTKIGATLVAPAATASTQSITVTATSVANSGQSGSVVITVPAAPAVTTTSAQLAGVVGSLYSVQLAASGGIPPYKWAMASGSTLPDCLTLSAGGVLTTASGTAPVASCAGTYADLQFQVTDSGTDNALSATSALSVTIAAAPAIAFTGSVPAAATVNSAYAGGSAAASGGVGALTYAISAGALPGGITLDASTAALAGTPTAVGTFHFTVTASDRFGDSTSKGFQIVVGYPSVAISTGSALPTGYAGTAYAQALSASGGSESGYTWSVTSGASSLAALGLSLSGAGVVSGSTPVAGSASFTATVVDSALDSASASFSVTVNGMLSITTAATLPGGTVAVPYSQTLVASGGSGAGYTWSVTGGSASLTAVGLDVSAAGVVSGSLPVVGNASFTVKVMDSAGNSATADLAVTIGGGMTLRGFTTAFIPCGPQPSTKPAFRMNLANTSGFNRTVTTDGTGQFTFAGVPDGSFTLTPSLPGIEVLFSPATQAVTIRNGLPDVLPSFTAWLGMTVSGTVNYPGAHSGRIYVNLVNQNCGYGGGEGTSISAAGQFTIHGVPPGTYTLEAWMDPGDLGLVQGQPNTSDPTGSARHRGQRQCLRRFGHAGGQRPRRRSCRQSDAGQHHADDWRCSHLLCSCRRHRERDADGSGYIL